METPLQWAPFLSEPVPTWHLSRTSWVGVLPATGGINLHPDVFPRGTTTHCLNTGSTTKHAFTCPRVAFPDRQPNFTFTTEENKSPANHKEGLIKGALKCVIHVHIPCETIFGDTYRGWSWKSQMLGLPEAGYKEVFSITHDGLCLYMKTRLGPSESCGPGVIGSDTWHISLILQY